MPSSCMAYFLFFRAARLILISRFTILGRIAFILSSLLIMVEHSGRSRRMPRPIRPPSPTCLWAGMFIPAPSLPSTPSPRARRPPSGALRPLPVEVDGVKLTAGCAQPAADALVGAVSLHRFVQPDTSMTIGRDPRYFVELDKNNIKVEQYDSAQRQIPGMDGSFDWKKSFRDAKRTFTEEQVKGLIGLGIRLGPAAPGQLHPAALQQLAPLHALADGQHDAARTAHRCGADSVAMYCLEPREKMPASLEEIAEAEEEDIAIQCGWGPKEVLSENGKVSGVVFMRCTSVWDSQGRFAPM